MDHLLVKEVALAMAEGENPAEAELVWPGYIALAIVAIRAIQKNEHLPPPDEDLKNIINVLDLQ